MLKVFYKTPGIQWQPPEYKGEPEIPFIPTEKELDQLIAAVGKKLGAFLQLLKETGARPGEIKRLTWADIDFERRMVRIRPLKGSLPRILPISLKAIEMLKNLPKKSERIFARVIYGTFLKQRRNAAKNLQILAYSEYTSTRFAIGRQLWNIIKQKTYFTLNNYLATRTRQANRVRS